MRTNVTAVGKVIKTHEGASAVRINELKELRRSVLSTMLWENTFYESGDSIAFRIAELIPKVKPLDVANLAIEARDRMYLRHVPLFIARELARIKGAGTHVTNILEHVIQRPDELSEYVAMYWRGATSDADKETLSAGSKRGLAKAFRKFNEYGFAKYDRDTVVKLRDVLRLIHAKPETAEQSALWRKVINRSLETPDTWEVALSKGADKKETFERLLRENKLGGLAFLRNLRNMVSAGVESELIRNRFSQPFEKVLPFRFVAACEHASTFLPELDAAMLRCIEAEKKLLGKTIILVDVSGSMDAPLSEKSDMTRVHAASGLAVLIREICPDVRVFTFSTHLVEVPAFRGLALVDKIRTSQAHHSTELGHALSRLPEYDRLIVVTDEQSHDRVNAPKGKGYMINVGTYKNGVGYGAWTHIDGWSDRVVDFIREVESTDESVS
jgi:hypothetical protein